MNTFNILLRFSVEVIVYSVVSKCVDYSQITLPSVRVFIGRETKIPLLKTNCCKLLESYWGQHDNSSVLYQDAKRNYLLEENIKTTRKIRKQEKNCKMKKCVYLTTYAELENLTDHKLSTTLRKEQCTELL